MAFNWRIGLLTLLGTVMAIGLVAARRAEAFQGFRCGTGRLVDEGDPSLEVRRRCGDPDFADSHEETRTVRRTVWTVIAGVPVAHDEEVSVSILVDEWAYDLGPDRFVRHLRFEQNRLVRVWTAGRGSDSAR
jgi:hypothetical protein